MKKILFLLAILFLSSQFYASPKKTRTIYSYDRSYPYIEFQLFLYEFDDFYTVLWAEEKKSEINLFFYDISEYEQLNKLLSDFKEQWDYGTTYHPIDSQAYAPGLYEKDLKILKNQFFAKMTDFAVFRKNACKTRDNSNIFEFVSKLYEYSAQEKEKKQETFDLTVINYYSTEKALNKIQDSDNFLDNFFSNYDNHLKILIYSANTNEFQSAITNYFSPLYPMNSFSYVDWSFFNLYDNDDYQSEGIYKYGNATINHSPDLVLLPDNTDSIIDQSESISFTDIKDLYDEIKPNLIDYPEKLISNENTITAIPIQTYYGVLFYRRSLAKKYLGTDDPAKIQQYLSDWQKFVNTARLLNKKSNGRCKIVSSFDELMRSFNIPSKKFWLSKAVDTPDSEMNLYMDICKLLYDENLVYGTRMLKNDNSFTFYEGWIKGLKNQLTDKNGEPVEIFACFLPTWGLKYVLKESAPETAGDWAMIEGPSPFYWESVCIAVTQKNLKTKKAKKFIKNLTTNEGFLKKWAINEGGMITNKNVINQLKDSYSDPFLGNQKPFEIIYNLTKTVKIDLDTHQKVRWNLYHFNKYWRNYLYAFLEGSLSKEQVFNRFKEKEINYFFDFDE